MQEQRSVNRRAVIRSRFGLFAICTALLALSAGAIAKDVEVTVISPNIEGAPISTGYRWVLQEDVTFEAIRGTALEDTLATNFTKSYIPVVSNGHCADAGPCTVPIPDDSKRYYLSILPDQPDGIDCQQLDMCFTMSGKQINPGMTEALIVTTPQPLPTAQMYVMAHADVNPINTRLDDAEGEAGLGGFDVFIFDFSGGILSVDNYGNPLGTEYELDGDGATPNVTRLGDGTIHTMTIEEVGDPLRNPHNLVVGEALIKNLAPGKYGVRIVPPQGLGWQQTSTIEGTKTIDAWIKAGEPRYAQEFSIRAGRHHAAFGFVRPDGFAPLASLAAPDGRGSISGVNRNLRLSRAPNYDFSNAEPLLNCWVALNEAANLRGVYAAPCNDDSTFSIPDVPAGTYQLIIFDRFLNLIYNTQNVTVVANQDSVVGGPDGIGTFRWFGTLEQWSFYDANEDGMWDRSDPAEIPLDEQATILRFRDGSVYQESATDFDGFVPFEELFPFFNWLVAEVDFARFKHTGTTITVDNGGQVLDDGDGGFGEGRRNPQLQDPADGGTNCGLDNGTENNGCLTRTETGPALLEGYNLAIGSNSKIEWGKTEWAEGENGGISGVVYYATTRAEDDPRFAAAEPWEPGVPRVQINLYESDAEGNITDQGSDGIQYADIDNYPLGWADGGARGPEDVDHNGNMAFELGDAIEFAHTDSWDDSLPEDCPADSDNYDPTDPFNLPTNGDPSTMFNGRCYDGLRNFNQIRPAVFDGGFGLGPPWTGMTDVDNAPVGWSTGSAKGDEDVDHNGDGVYDVIEYLAPGFYVVEAATPPGYTTLKEQDKNVDFGDTFTVSPLALPPVCVGEDNVIAGDEQLALFPGVDAPYQGTTRPLCDRKVVQITDGKNMAADFFVHTEAPVAGQWKGFSLNDLANEFDNVSPNFGEKFAPAFISVSVRDWAGNEVYHTTTDGWGTYNVLVPSSFRINTPMASGVSANVLQICLNSAVMENPNFNPNLPVDPVSNPYRIADPDFNKQYSQFCYPFNAHAGLTTYLDTPLFPIAAFTGPNNWQLDCEYPDFTPVIHSVSVDANGVGGGPYATLAARDIVITSVGMVDVLDPNADRIAGENATFVTRNFGFGDSQGTGTITINGVPLTGVVWDDIVLQATIPAGVTTGQLIITRDNGLSTPVAVTVIIDDGSIPLVTQVPQDGSMSIQDAIDITPAGGVVLVPPGNYRESLIVTKPIQLQGWGAASTIIQAALSPLEKITEWREKVNELVNCTNEIELLRAEIGPLEPFTGLPLVDRGEDQFNNVPNANAACGFTPGTGLFAAEEAPAVMVATRNGVFDGANPARIDGFTITGAVNSHGVFVNGYADFLEISNNLITNNQGKSGAGGIRVGIARELATERLSSDIDYMNIHHNNISQNGSFSGFGGGIGIYRGAENYRITNNYVCGNFAQNDGGGIAHYGLSNNGLIADNKILLNQSFSQGPGLADNGGGLLISGAVPLVVFESEVETALIFEVTEGSGSVKVLRNLIQGNNAASGDGGGIALANINGQDVVASANQDTWHHIDILDNIIVNNVAGMAGGGISLKDALKVSIVNNTVMNNDSTATSFAAFGTCTTAQGFPNESCPQPAGIVSYANSPDLVDTDEAVGPFSNPTMINNIVVGNRSQYWLIGPGPNGHDIGELLPAPGPSDFGVFPPSAGTLTTVNSIFTTGSDAAGHVLGGLNGGVVIGTGAYVQTGGIATVEAEHFTTNVAAGGIAAWDVIPQPDASETTAIKAALGARSNSGAGPFTTYEVQLDAGQQYVWFRFRSFNSQTDSFYFQFNGETIQARFLNPDNGQWNWTELSSITVPTAGVYTITVYRRERETELDKFVMTTGSAFDPRPLNGGLGPDESPQDIGGPGSNFEVDGTIPVGPCTDATGECGIVINPYRNSPPDFVLVQPDGTIIPGGEFPADAVPALDEGGNFIDVHYGPLSPVGDYHLQEAFPPNIAIEAGASPSAYPDSVLDIDREARPQGATAVGAAYDIGADEVPGAAVGVNSNAPPQIITPQDGNGTNNISAYTAQAFNLHVQAVDPNGNPLTYSLCRDTGGGCIIGDLPVGMAINSTTGVITWPAPGAPAGGTSEALDGFQVTASDGILADTHTFSIVLRAVDAPVAVDDFYEYNSPGQLIAGIQTPVIDPASNDTVVVTFAPTTLDNDDIPDEDDYGLVSTAITTSPAAGTVTSATVIGGFVYTPPDYNFIGTATFEYEASNNVGSDTGQVSVTRNIFVTDARFETATGHYVITGFGRTGTTVTVRLSQTGVPGSCLLGTTAAIAAGGATNGGPDGGPWTLDVPWAATSCPAALPDTDYAVDVVDSLNNQAVPQMGTVLLDVTDIPLLRGAAYSPAPLSTAYVQCPGDTDGDAIIDDPSAVAGRQVVCKHLGAGDGFTVLGDGRELYGFSFSDLTGVPENLAIDKGILNAQFPAPTLEFNENDEVYLTLTNVAMLIRPDLFDPHTVHFHGFPNASSTFDGVPESSISINGGFSLTYYYNVVEPGTYMYHCHVEAAEHMQMGMLGNLYVNPAQNGTSILNVDDGKTYDQFVYNDEDGTTGYDIVVPIQLGAFDSAFHDASFLVQALPFADMRDDYPLLNGRGYPHTVDPNPIPSNSPDVDCDTDDTNAAKRCAGVTSSEESSNVVNSLIEAVAGQKILLRMSNLNVTQFNTMATTGGLTMQVVGTGAKIMQGPGGDKLYYKTNSVTLGGGQAFDVLIDTTGVPAGTYLLYSTNLNELSNGTEDFGGMMTEIIITAP